MPTPSRASVVPLADQIGGAAGEPPAVQTSRRRTKRSEPEQGSNAEGEGATPEAPRPLPRPEQRGGAKSIIQKLIRFDAAEAGRLEAAADELQCTQTALVKSAVAYYLDLLDQERKPTR